LVFLRGLGGGDQTATANERDPRSEQRRYQVLVTTLRHI
jgi:hypothetical protein